MEREECIALLREEGVPDHIIHHSRVVAEVSVFIGRRLMEAGHPLDLRLIEAGALLHDVAKHRSIAGGGDHALMGAELLRGLGQRELAEIVRYHVRLPEGWDLARIHEISVVHYGDKRVKHTQVVSLEERFDDILQRYGRDEATRSLLNRLFRQTQRLEKALFAPLAIAPDDLPDVSISARE